MTATELHDLYAPLWEKVPDARPEGLDYFVSSRGHTPMFLMEMDSWDEGCRQNSILPVETAAALCRVAAEDWLMLRSIVSIDSDGERAGVMVNLGGGRGSRDFEGPTLHHALVAACLAVAQPGGK